MRQRAVRRGRRPGAGAASAVVHLVAGRRRTVRSLPGHQQVAGGVRNRRHGGRGRHVDRVAGLDQELRLDGSHSAGEHRVHRVAQRNGEGAIVLRKREAADRHADGLRRFARRKRNRAGRKVLFARQRGTFADAPVHGYSEIAGPGQRHREPYRPGSRSAAQVGDAQDGVEFVVPYRHGRPDGTLAGWRDAGNRLVQFVGAADVDVRKGVGQQFQRHGAVGAPRGVIVGGNLDGVLVHRQVEGIPLLVAGVFAGYVGAGVRHAISDPGVDRRIAGLGVVEQSRMVPVAGDHEANRIALVDLILFGGHGDRRVRVAHAQAQRVRRAHRVARAVVEVALGAGEVVEQAAVVVLHPAVDPAALDVAAGQHGGAKPGRYRTDPAGSGIHAPGCRARTRRRPHCRTGSSDG